MDFTAYTGSEKAGGDIKVKTVNWGSDSKQDSTPGMS
jgi:hypothetical protein